MTSYHRQRKSGWKVLYTAIWGILFLAVVSSGCAFFNTFYLTRKNFRDGEFERNRDKGVLSSKSKKSYTEAIEWGSEVLDKYRTSRYVDDSLYIMGMSYYHLEQYVDARTKFDELIIAFPESELVPSSTYYKAKCLIELSQDEVAREMLLELMNSDNRSVAGYAALALAENDYDREDWTALIKSSERVIESDPDRDVLSQALYLKGEALSRLERYDESVEILREVSGRKVAPELRYKVNSGIAMAEAKQGNYDVAMSYLERMENKGEFSEFAPKIRLDLGSIHEIRGDDEEAVGAYTRLAGDYPDSVAAKEAWYRIGTIIIKDLSKADAAKDAFDMVKKGKARTTAAWVVDAELKSAQIDSLKAKTRVIERIDSEDTEKLARARFSLAELFTFSFGRPDSALTQYRFITEEAPDSEFAVKSTYFIDYNELDQSGTLSEETEKGLMEDLIDKYPDSEFAQDLKVYLGMIEYTPDEKSFMDAEMARMNGDGSEVYMPLYEKVVETFPASKSAYRARLTMAYYYEHDVGDFELSLELFTALAEEETSANAEIYITAAKDKLEYLKRESALLEEKTQNIAYYNSIIDGSFKVLEDEKALAGADGDGKGAGYTGYRKIRERNARIRSRYYSN